MNESVLDDDPDRVVQFLVDHVTEDTAFLVLVVLARAAQFFLHPLGYNWQGDDLCVRMLQRGPGFTSPVLEDHDVFHPWILAQVHAPVSQRPDDLLDMLDGQIGIAVVVVG